MHDSKLDEIYYASTGQVLREQDKKIVFAYARSVLAVAAEQTNNAFEKRMKEDYLLATRLIEGHRPETAPAMTLPLSSGLYSLLTRTPTLPQADTLSLEEMTKVVAGIAYPGYAFHVLLDGDRPYLQAEFHAPDIKTGQPTLQKSRKWTLSTHMTKSELVQTAFKLVTTAVEHETREKFAYRGSHVFGPHFDVEALEDLCARRAFDYRQEK